MMKAANSSDVSIWRHFSGAAGRRAPDYGGNEEAERKPLKQKLKADSHTAFPFHAYQPQRVQIHVLTDFPSNPFITQNGSIVCYDEGTMLLAGHCQCKHAYSGPHCSVPKVVTSSSGSYPPSYYALRFIRKNVVTSTALT